MQQDPKPPKCGHVSQFAFMTVGQHGAAEATRPIGCGAPATFRVGNGHDQHLRCSDHLAEFLVGGMETAWVVRIGDNAPSADAALTAAGAPVTLDRFQEWHATLVERVELIIAQRDRLQSAIAWLNENPDRLVEVRNEIARAQAEALADAKKWTWGNEQLSLQERVDMATPSVGATIADLMAPISINRTAERAKHAAVMEQLLNIKTELRQIAKRSGDEQV